MPVLSVELMLNRFVFISKGKKVADLRDSLPTPWVMKFAEFRGMYAASRTLMPNGVPFDNAVLWLEHPDRMTMSDEKTYREWHASHSRTPV